MNPEYFDHPQALQFLMKYKIRPTVFAGAFKGLDLYDITYEMLIEEGESPARAHAFLRGKQSP